MGFTLHLSSIIDLALMEWMQGSQSKGIGAGELPLHLVSCYTGRSSQCSAGEYALVVWGQASCCADYSATTQAQIQSFELAPQHLFPLRTEGTKGLNL